MKRLICTLIVLTVFLFCNYTLSQKASAFEELNGYDWQDLPEYFKLGHIIGIRHGALHAVAQYNIQLELQGLLTRQNVIKSVKIHNQILGFYGATNGQVIEGVNEAYKDYLNKMITVPDIMHLVFRKIRGELGTEEMEKELQKLRAAASKK